MEKLQTNQVIKSKVAGTTFHQFDWNQIKAGMELVWKREPDNQYDANAIMLGYNEPVFNQFVHVGYINKHQAAKLAPWLDDAKEDVKMVIRVSALTGGDLDMNGKEKARGINIDIELGNIDFTQYYDIETLYFT